MCVCVCVHFIKCFHDVMLFIIFGVFFFDNFIFGVFLSYLKEYRRFILKKELQHPLPPYWSPLATDITNLLV